MLKYLDDKRKGIKSTEEETEIDAEKARKDKSIQYPEIWKRIQEKKGWKRAFDKIPLELQPEIMKKFVEENLKYKNKVRLKRGSFQLIMASY